LLLLLLNLGAYHLLGPLLAVLERLLLLLDHLLILNLLRGMICGHHWNLKFHLLLLLRLLLHDHARLWRDSLDNTPLRVSVHIHKLRRLLNHSDLVHGRLLHPLKDHWVERSVHEVLVDHAKIIGPLIQRLRLLSKSFDIARNLLQRLRHLLKSGALPELRVLLRLLLRLLLALNDHLV
jgi:hypothetical protein